MSEPEHPSAAPATSASGPVDDRREDPPPPAAATVADGEQDASATSEAQRETTETIRSISRLEESN